MLLLLVLLGTLRMTLRVMMVVTQFRMVTRHAIHGGVGK